MAKLKCAISGLTFSISSVPITISETSGYFHPIFAAENKQLYSLYVKYLANQLTETDSYLLFLAFMHSTDKIKWNYPAKCNPNKPTTKALVANNIQQLIRVIETTNLITHPKFKQPGFSVNKDNCNLLQVPNWIKAWEHNIVAFNNNYYSERIYEKLKKVENKLTNFLHSSMSPEEYVFAVANWAALAADFPKDKAEDWKKIIRSCYNKKKMFATPLATLREIKSYCEENIELGSIHSYSLFGALKTGIANHSDFLGMDTISNLGYTLLSLDTTKNEQEIQSIKAKATLEPPNRLDYASNFEYIKAKLRYKVAIKDLEKDTEPEPESKLNQLNIQGKNTKL